MSNRIIVGFGLVVLLITSISGCGYAERMTAYVTSASEICHDGVIYVQFSSGASVKYKQDGTIATCKK